MDSSFVEERAVLQTDPYAASQFGLYFLHPGTEAQYQDMILTRMINFYRITWGLVIALVAGFTLLDRSVFGGWAPWIFRIRVVMMVLSLGMLLASLRPAFQRHMAKCGAVFITLVGGFCLLLVALGDRAAFSPYFTGLLYAYTGVFILAGLGFRYHVWALLGNWALFAVLSWGFIAWPRNLLLLYHFFLASMGLIFGYVAYLVEKASRDNFRSATRLGESMDEVRQLSGLLPICASCKQIRDDQGYWKEIETYIEVHSDALFSHGLCPQCEERLYGDEAWYQKRKQAILGSDGI